MKWLQESSRTYRSTSEASNGLPLCPTYVLEINCQTIAPIESPRPGEVCNCLAGISCKSGVRARNHHCKNSKPHWKSGTGWDWATWITWIDHRLRLARYWLVTNSMTRDLWRDCSRQSRKQRLPLWEGQMLSNLSRSPAGCQPWCRMMLQNPLVKSQGGFLSEKQHVSESSSTNMSLTK